MIVHSETDTQKTTASKLADKLDLPIVLRLKVGSIMEIQTAGELCVILSELLKPLLSSITPGQFANPPRSAGFYERPKAPILIQAILSRLR